MSLVVVLVAFCAGLLFGGGMVAWFLLDTAVDDGRYTEPTHPDGVNRGH